MSMMDEVKNYDNLLFPILNHEGKIDGFLDAVFEFLYRRTDFFRILLPGSKDCLGLPPGAAESLVKAAFVKYMKRANSEVSMRDPLQADYDVPIDCVAEEVEVSEEPDNTENKKEESIVTSSMGSPKSSELNDTGYRKTSGSADENKVYVSDCESYNGASYDKYSWSQNLKDLDVLVKVPENVVSGQQAKVNINHSHLKVEVLGKGEWLVIVDEDLASKVNVEESVWTLVPHEHIHICLHKMQQKWWDACFTSEPKIDVRAIDASQPFEDLDEEAQAKIQELMYKQHMKRLGKPTEQQSNMTEILREAWNQENSPFRGQPFDPSIINFSDSSEIPEVLKSK